MAKLTDKELATLARKREAVKEEMAELQDKYDKFSDKILTELEKRGTKAIEHDGVRIAYVQGKSTIYNFDAMKKSLPTPLLKKITKEVLDTSALQEMVQKGKISPAKLAKFTEIRENAPYPKISFKDSE